MVGAEWGEKPKFTFDEAALSFLDQHCPKLRPQSARRYETSLAKLTPHLTGLLLDDIGGAVLAEYERKRRAEGVTPTTIRRDLLCLSSIFTHAIADLEWIETNPVSPYLKRASRRGTLREGQPKTRYLSHDEESRLLRAAAPDLADAIAFAIDTGLRLEEQFGLTWDRIDLDRKVIVIPADKAKGRRERWVPLLDRPAQIAAHLRATQATIKRRRDEPAYVFAKKNGKRYHDRRNGLELAVRRAKIRPRITWHDLRRTCGCRLLQDRGLSKEEVQEWLGHESVSTTERAYAFLRVDHLRRRVDRHNEPEGDRHKIGTSAAD